MAFGRRTGGDGREKPRSRNLTVKREHKYLAIHARSSPKVYAHVRSRSRQQRSGKELTKTRGREVWEEIPFGVTVRSQAHETLGAMTTVIMRTSEGDMRVMFLLWDATSGNKSLKIVEIPIKTAPRALNNPDFPEK